MVQHVKEGLGVGAALISQDLGIPISPLDQLVSSHLPINCTQDFPPLNPDSYSTPLPADPNAMADNSPLPNSQGTPSNPADDFSLPNGQGTP